MITSQENCKPLIAFLTGRWSLISNLAALERVYMASYKFAQDNDLPLPQMPPILASQPSRQIEIIKQHIIKILPEAHFIDYDYEAQAPLDPADFMEVYIADHKQCIKKVRNILVKMQVR